MAYARTLKVVDGDIVRYTRGTGYYTVEGKDKVKQDVRMCLTTSIRSSTSIGCGLDDIIGKDIENPASTYFNFPLGFEFQNRLSNGLNRLISAQKRYLVGFRPATELIADFSEVRTWRLSGDQRSFKWAVEIYTVDGRSNFTISGTGQG